MTDTASQTTPSIPQDVLDAARRPALKRVAEFRKAADCKCWGFLDAFATSLFDRDKQIRELWEDAEITPQHDSSLVRAALGGLPPGQCRTELRTDTALELLRDPTLYFVPLAHVACGAAFKNTRALNDAVQKRCGVPAEEFRAQFSAYNDAAPGLLHASRILVPAEGPGNAPTPQQHVRELNEKSLSLMFCGRLDDAGAVLDHALALSVEHRLSAGDHVVAHQALLAHCRGQRAFLDGDVDRAYDHLRNAARCYRAAGTLPRAVRRGKMLLISEDTTATFLRPVCATCRQRFLGPEGERLRHHLQRALDPVPLYLEWFSSCCDTCYRHVWQAFERARFALTQDALRAWWIAEHADVDDRTGPVTLGRYVATLEAADRLTFGNQEERRTYCQLAVNDAHDLDREELVGNAQVYLANAQRTTARDVKGYAAARKSLSLARDVCARNPWTAALHARMNASLLSDTGKGRKAVQEAERAAELYGELDEHLAGNMSLKLGHLQLTRRDDEAALASLLEAKDRLDPRRDALKVEGVLPLSLTDAYAKLGRLGEARKALESCRFDRARQPAMAAVERSNQAAFHLFRGEMRTAATGFLEASQALAGLRQYRLAATAAVYSVEANAALGRREEALAATEEALRYFTLADQAETAVEAIKRIRADLRETVLNVAAIATAVRELALQHGGWLPTQHG